MSLKKAPLRQEAFPLKHKGSMPFAVFCFLFFFPLLSPVVNGEMASEVTWLICCPFSQSTTVRPVHQPAFHICVCVCVFDRIQSALVCAHVHELMHAPMCPFACMHIFQRVCSSPDPVPFFPFFLCIESYS